MILLVAGTFQDMIIPAYNCVKYLVLFNHV